MKTLRSTGKVAAGTSVRQLAQQYGLRPPVLLSELIDKLGIHGHPEIPFVYGVHNLSFPNFYDGVPDLGTFKDTFGTAEVLDEMFDPIFGHPYLTAAFYAFYHYYLKGTARGGLATGFCTALASLVADNFWTRKPNTHTITKQDVHKWTTAVHGKLLSRQTLLHFHDQGREGLPRVERTCREIEAAFLRGLDRKSAPLIFFIPSGEIWDHHYFDKLKDSHCVMPYRFRYPPGHSGPQLSPDGKTTISDLNGVELLVWDCKNPELPQGGSPDSKFVFTNNGGQIDFEYFPDSVTSPGVKDPDLYSQNGFTLGVWTNGDYLLADHDMPFTGPYNLQLFILDFIFSPADLHVTDQNGRRTGTFDGLIRAEIPDSHPCYLVPGAYALPASTPLTRVITGRGTGQYTFNSLTPGGSSLALENVATAVGQQDVLLMNPEQTQLSFTPAIGKTFNLTVARWVGDEARAIAIQGVVGGPTARVDVRSSPELTSVHLKNGGAARDLKVQTFVLRRKNKTTVGRTLSAVDVPTNSTLSIDIADWKTANATLVISGTQ
jgi:hypothetical protein